WPGLPQQRSDAQLSTVHQNPSPFVATAQPVILLTSMSIREENCAETANRPVFLDCVEHRKYTY
ncbi:hypothetical protein NECAME_18012, partial [Necator americanus]